MAYQAWEVNFDRQSPVCSVVPNDNGSSLAHFSGPHWEFDEAVTKVLDDNAGSGRPIGWSIDSTEY
jgi:hypothetical protein